MAIGLQGPADVTVTIEDAPGGTARNIENFLINGISAKVLSRMFRRLFLEQLQTAFFDLVEGRSPDPRGWRTPVAS